jgi:hypothetical protein
MGTQINHPTAYDAPVTADVTPSDVFQASAATQYQTPKLSGKIVGVVPFVWAKNVYASTPINNLTSANAKLLLGGTLTEDKLFSGGEATTHVYAFGSDEDSGTRIAALADSGYGVHADLAQTRSQPEAARMVLPQNEVAIASLRLALSVPCSEHASRHSRITPRRLRFKAGVNESLRSNL